MEVHSRERVSLQWPIHVRSSSMKMTVRTSDEQLTRFRSAHKLPARSPAPTNRVRTDRMSALRNSNIFSHLRLPLIQLIQLLRETVSHYMSTHEQHISPKMIEPPCDGSSSMAGSSSPRPGDYLSTPVPIHTRKRRFISS